MIRMTCQPAFAALKGPGNRERRTQCRCHAEPGKGVIRMSDGVLMPQ
ncbi:hypothetical protein PVT71_07150 [Salipiger sp. H15]|uniref:Uncharacterized protein n=1 Tax=Alloyangia sp. H15 TaxID=3029062 RepID=A0AAU8AK43_9RHOB